MRKCLNDELCLLPAAKEKKCSRFPHRHIESTPRETLRQRRRIVEILHDFKGAAIVQFADHQLLSLFWQLVVGGGAGWFAAAIYKEEFAARTQRGCQHIQKGIKAFERHVGEPEAEKDPVKGARWLPGKQVRQHILDSLAIDSDAVDGNHFA